MRLLTKVLNTTWDEGPFWTRDRNLFLSSLGKHETIGSDFVSYVRDVYKANGPVFTCIMVRMMVFSEALLRWQEFDQGKPGDLFWDDELALLDRPWENANTGTLLAHMEIDASLAGNFYGVRVSDSHGERIRRLSPDTVKILTGSPTDDPFDYRARVVGYIYDPRRSFGSSHSDPVTFTAKQIVHYAPEPDPGAQWRGMSWITPVLSEIQGDKAAQRHKLKFFENGAIPGLTLSYDASIGEDDFRTYVKLFEETHQGLDKAYKALHLAGGVTPAAVGADLRQLDFKTVQGAGESRIAAASGLGAVMAQFSEGMQGSSLNTGNFTAARKRAETILFRPLWRKGAAALESVLERPSRPARLWYDTSDVAFLRDDAKDEAEIRRSNALTIEALIRSGAQFDSAVEAVTSGNFKQLEDSGLRSVQLQPPGEEDES